MELEARTLAEIERSGRDARAVQQQLRQLRAGPRAVRVDRPCTPGDGIRQLPRDRWDSLRSAWRRAAKAGRLSAFVPASGAATRMIASLSRLRERAGGPLSLAQVQRWATRDPGLRPGGRALASLEELAVGALLARRGEQLDPADVRPALEALVGESGIARGPKALVPFHRYPDGRVRTALAEQLVEACELVRDASGRVRVHFTMPVRDHGAAREEAAAVMGELECALELQLSRQDPRTDTVALAGDELARDASGRLIFRPGGHGALVGNLASTGGDLVLVKNIDNIVPDARRAPVLRWRRLLVGALIELEEQVHGALRALDAGDPSPARAVARQLPGPPVGEDPAALYERLHRPLRVAGMVPQDGQPGGGPFWLDGGQAQIVELVQIDREDPAQRAAVEASTHFNPVDMVCGLRDHRGRPYELHRFVDDESVIIVEKVVGGRALRVIERPGLWNGGMAGWLTWFVELPREVFQPVKTLADLLGEGHRASR